MKKATVKDKVWCVKHGKECPVVWSHIHVAGVPCIDHSSWGKRKGDKGSTNIVYYTWAATRAKMREPVVVLENVAQFGIDMTERLLGHLYEWERVLVNPLQLGWKTSRNRQFLIGILKQRQNQFIVQEVSVYPEWLPTHMAFDPCACEFLTVVSRRVEPYTEIFSGPIAHLRQRLGPPGPHGPHGSMEGSREVTW